MQPINLVTPLRDYTPSHNGSGNPDLIYSSITVVVVSCLYVEVRREEELIHELGAYWIIGR